MKLKEIAERWGGTIEGDENLEITDARGIDFAEAGHITYIKDKKMARQLGECSATAVIVPEALELDMAQWIHPNPPLAFARILAEFHPTPRPQPGVSPQAVVAESATLGKDAFVSPQVCIGENVTIGDGVVLHPGVVIYDNCRIGNEVTLHAHVTLYQDTLIGNNVTVHAGTVIGTDGFGYAPDEKGRHNKIQQIGRVVIEDDVEIGANSCIDRATFGETVIREGAKIDNLVQVAHNCEVGANTILVSQVGLAGTCKLGRNVILAGQVGLADHITLGDQVIVAAQSGVNKDLKEPGFYGGAPAIPALPWKKYLTVFPKLPEMSQKIRQLEKRINEIEKP